MPNMFDYYYGQDPGVKERNNAGSYLNYAPSKPSSLMDVGNFQGSRYNSPPTTSSSATAPAAAQQAGGGLTMDAVNPYLALAGGAMSVYGAYQDQKARERAEKEERRRYDRQEAYGRRQDREANQRTNQSHDANMRVADRDFARGYQDRLLQLAGYKGV